VTTPCDDLDTFFDGELSADAAQAFRIHLASCTRCQHALRGRMLEAVVMGHGAESCAWPAGGGSGQFPDQLAARRRSRRWTMIVAAVAASIALVSGPEREQSDSSPTVADRPTRPPGPTILALADVRLAAKRPFEVRFSTAELDRHRPPNVVRSADPAEREQISRATLAKLEGQGHLNALVAALALDGEVRSAGEAAKRLPSTAQSLSDRAALELLRFSDPGKRIPPADQQQAAEQAISLAAAALQLDPSCTQAKWNQAIALQRLGLPLAAAQAYDDVTAKAEPGWAAEAKDSAQRLRDEVRAEADDWKRQQDRAEQMIGGGAIITAENAQQYPSLARRALVLAIATASTTERLDALLPLARTLDSVYATTAMVSLVARIRGSNLAERAPVARALRDLVLERTSWEALVPLRAQGLQRGLGDIVLASFLVQSDGTTDDSDLALLAKLVADSREPWWRLFELTRRAWVLEYGKRDFSRAEATARAALSLCAATPSSWCGQAARTAGDANAAMGRLDLAFAQLEAARRMAREPATRDDESPVLNVIAQAMSVRVQETVDAVAVSDAYYNEIELRGAGCRIRLQRLDFLANAALDRHRYLQAVEFRARADALEAGDCRNERLRVNGEAARLRLVATGHGDATTLQPKLDTLESATNKNVTSYVRYLRAAATTMTNPARGEAALRGVIADANAAPGEPNAPQARASAYATLIELAGAAGDADNVLALLAHRLGVAIPGGCLVGVAQWNRAVVAVRGADGAAVVQIRDVPEGSIMLPPGELIAGSLQARLVGCHRVEVIASGPYFGRANLLGPTMAWAYKSSSKATAGPPQVGSELIVTDVRPPDDVSLPALKSFRGAPSATVLSRARATPSATLDRMRTAGLIVIVAHGITDAREPSAASLILSPDRDGDYLLTASKVSAAHLDGSPVVVLAGCDAGRVAVSAEPWSLATSFLAAGARAVIAPTERIPDDEAGKAFESLVARVRSGVDPVDALQAERSDRGSDAAWLSSIIVFE
jgi:hypothetical protein